MDLLTLGQLAGGLALLALGAEMLVRGASRLAAAAGISPLVVGLTVVAFGTSAPELAVCVHAAVAGQADLALGNVVGSSIFNVLFVLGLSALILPLAVSSQLVRLDVPIMIAAAVALWLLAADGRLGRLDGSLLFAGIVAYSALLVYLSRHESARVAAEFAAEYGPASTAPRAAVQAALVLGGLVLLVAGAQAFVAGAVTLARALAVSELVIGLTVVAIGTSLPEVATSIVAAARGERDIAVGNIVGSNTFNLLAIQGAASLVASDGVRVAPAALGFDIPVMTAVAVACLPIFLTGHCIARWEGALFLGYYGAYTAYLLLAAVEHEALPAFSFAMGAFVLPLTAVTLAVLAARALRAGARRRESLAPRHPARGRRRS